MITDALRHVHARSTSPATSYRGAHAEMEDADLQVVMALCLASVGFCLVLALFWLMRDSPIGLQTVRRVVCVGGPLISNVDMEEGTGLGSVESRRTRPAAPLAFTALGLSNACVDHAKKL